ncbi:MAG: hypothetical protein C4518_05020 [Desulfobacteraceae bacterium]|nr:MAG: hypothetical protein C4518_05020 [Desulfobacteraceae bacterium]
MTTTDEIKNKPLWLLIEETFLGLNVQELSGQGKEKAIQKIAGELDNTGYNVSRSGGGMLQLRWAMDDMLKVGHPMLKDFNDALAALTLEDVLDPYAATATLLNNLGGTWKELRNADRRTEIIKAVEKARLDLLVKKAKALTGDESIRFLIKEDVASELIISELGITAEKLAEVIAAIAAEKAEIKRVETLLTAVDGKPDAERVKHLLTNNVAEALIIEMAKVDQAAIDNVKKAMEEEIKEKERLAAEEAAKKKAAAEGPSLDAIAPDQMIAFIDSIREIMEFSEEEKEIRTMCEQSSIPKSLVDVAVSDPAKLDELEKAAQG